MNKSADKPQHSLRVGLHAIHFLSIVFLILALVGVMALVGWDVLHHLAFTDMHQRLDSWPLISIGLSYICLQLGSKSDRIERAKGIALGVAFILWGCDQLLPASRMVTIMDEFVIAIFVIDLGWMIVGKLKSSM